MTVEDIGKSVNIIRRPDESFESLVDRVTDKITGRKDFVNEMKYLVSLKMELMQER